MVEYLISMFLKTMTLGTLGDVVVGTITSQCEGPGLKKIQAWSVLSAV